MITNHIKLVHLHGFWRPLHLVMAKAAFELDIPVILTPHGMLEPWALNNNGLIKAIKKNIYLSFLIYTQLQMTLNFNLMEVQIVVQTIMLQKLQQLSMLTIMKLIVPQM